MGEKNFDLENLENKYKEVKKKLQILENLMESVPISIIISTSEGNLSNGNWIISSKKNY